MGRHRNYAPPRAIAGGVGGDTFGRHTRSPWSLPIFAFTAALAFVVVLIFAPDPEPVAAASLVHTGPAQRLSVAGDYTASAKRDGYSVTKKAAAALASATPVGDAQLIAYGLVHARGWGDDEFACLVALWTKESHWSTTAGNPVSGAYGIPQALPGSKMASAGPDWQTDATTQITWGLGYIAGRYGTPCVAWQHSVASNWY